MNQQRWVGTLLYSYRHALEIIYGVNIFSNYKFFYNIPNLCIRQKLTLSH